VNSFMTGLVTAVAGIPDCRVTSVYTDEDGFEISGKVVGQQPCDF